MYFSIAKKYLKTSSTQKIFEAKEYDNWMWFLEGFVFN